ncbi:MAG: hypothetical protein M1820_008732 [Bogoriella megaspora]|nr:MAG: hypothetical protein M1820_008732 [Bogoriella megaspora]
MDNTNSNTPHTGAHNGVADTAAINQIVQEVEARRSSATEPYSPTHDEVAAKSGATATASTADHSNDGPTVESGSTDITVPSEAGEASEAKLEVLEAGSSIIPDYTGFDYPTAGPTTVFFVRVRFAFALTQYVKTNPRASPPSSLHTIASSNDSHDTAVTARPFQAPIIGTGNDDFGGIYVTVELANRGNQFGELDAALPAIPDGDLQEQDQNEGVPSVLMQIKAALHFLKHRFTHVSRSVATTWAAVEEDIEASLPHLLPLSSLPDRIARCCPNLLSPEVNRLTLAFAAAAVCTAITTVVTAVLVHKRYKKVIVLCGAATLVAFASIAMRRAKRPWVEVLTFAGVVAAIGVWAVP